MIHNNSLGHAKPIIRGRLGPEIKPIKPTSPLSQSNSLGVLPLLMVIPLSIPVGPAVAAGDRPSPATDARSHRREHRRKDISNSAVDRRQFCHREEAPIAPVSESLLPRYRI